MGIFWVQHLQSFNNFIQVELGIHFRELVCGNLEHSVFTFILSYFWDMAEFKYEPIV